MIESFIAGFTTYFDVIDSLSSAPNYLGLANKQNRGRQTRRALEGTKVAAMIMLFIASYGAWILSHLNISVATFKIAGGIILFFVALDMLAAKRQSREHAKSTGIKATDKIGSDKTTIYLLAIPLGLTRLQLCL